MNIFFRSRAVHLCFDIFLEAAMFLDDIIRDLLFILSCGTFSSSFSSFSSDQDDAFFQRKKRGRGINENRNREHRETRKAREPDPKSDGDGLVYIA